VVLWGRYPGASLRFTPGYSPVSLRDQQPWVSAPNNSGKMWVKTRITPRVRVRPRPPKPWKGAIGLRYAALSELGGFDAPVSQGVAPGLDSTSPSGSTLACLT